MDLEVKVCVFSRKNIGIVRGGVSEAITQKKNYMGFAQFAVKVKYYIHRVVSNHWTFGTALNNYWAVGYIQSCKKSRFE